MLLACCMGASAQDETVKKLRDEAGRIVNKDAVDTINLPWKTGMLYNLAVTQGTLNNWAAGGDDFSLSLASVFNLYGFYKKGKHSWDNTLDFNLGYVNTSSLGARKNDDRLDVLSKYGYSVAPRFNLAGLVNFRSQLFRGYTYDEDNNEQFSSSFLSPAYVTVSTGMDYKSQQGLSVFASPITARWVIVKNDSLSARGLYGVDTGRHSNLEVGAFVTANFTRELTKTIAYRGRLDLFSNYRHNPQNIDLFMTNLFSAKISKLLSVTWNIDLIYDDDVRIFGSKGTSPSLQVKSLIGAGLLLRLDNLPKSQKEAS